MLVFIGDIHGEFKELADKLAMTNVRDSSFIQVGDFGVGLKTKENEFVQLQELNSQLKSGDNMMYIVRGNHDSPLYFNGDSSYSNITFLKDYTLLKLEGKTILLAGGAISIDRSARVLDSSYWKEEIFVYKETLLEEALEGCGKLDIMVTHSAPAEFHPLEINKLVFDWAKGDPTLISDLKKERYRHSLLLNGLEGKKLKPNFWYYGHYHFSFQSNFKGINYRILDCSELFEHK
jgi:UDP-2,3-diacylglucosamine pyrophosphatase LpxH